MTFAELFDDASCGLRSVLVQLRLDTPRRLALATSSAGEEELLYIALSMAHRPAGGCGRGLHTRATWGWGPCGSLSRRMW